QVGLGVDHHPEACAHELLVVDQGHTDLVGGGQVGHGSLRSGRGRVRRTRNPPPGRGPETRVPPNIAARSDMPSRPWPAPSDVAAAPRPSSDTSRTTLAAFHCCRTVTVGSGPACLSTLVRDSWHTRNSARPTPGGSGRGVPIRTRETRRPLSRIWSSSWSM